MLSFIKSRGALRCGVGAGTLGFSQQDVHGNWSGMDVDFCRAVAAAIFGDPTKVQFVTLTATARFPAIESKDIDILARTTTWTVQREAMFSVAFAGVLYYDSEVFVVRIDGPYADSDTLDGAQICVEDGSNQLADVTEYARLHDWRITTVPTKDVTEARRFFMNGKCNMLTDDLSTVPNMLQNLPFPGAYAVRPERVAKEPLGPLVRRDDGQWVGIVQAVYAVLIDADERGLTQAHAQMMSINSTDPADAAYFAETMPVGSAYGLAPDWAAKVIASVGNYGEMFQRNLGAGSPLNLDPGPNVPWTEGGLLYAPPFQ